MLFIVSSLSIAMVIKFHRNNHSLSCVVFTADLPVAHNIRMGMLNVLFCSFTLLRDQICNTNDSFHVFSCTEVTDVKPFINISHHIIQNGYYHFVSDELIFLSEIFLPFSCTECIYWSSLWVLVVTNTDSIIVP